MSSVFNFLKNKIKKCTASKSTEAAASRCVSHNHTNQPTGNFKVKKRTKNMFNLKLKKNTNSSTIQHYITSDIVILSNEYSLSPLVNRSGYEHDQNQGIKELTNMVENDSALSASCVSPYSKINSNSSEDFLSFFNFAETEKGELTPFPFLILLFQESCCHSQQSSLHFSSSCQR
jgi:hypothetical protein